MAAVDDLSDVHQDALVTYLRLMRYKRSQHLKTIQTSFTELKESRLTEPNFTKDEVADMLDGMCSVVYSDVDAELLNFSHTNGLMLKQMFEQAEKWHLKLETDISTLENRDSLDEIAQFEREQFSGLGKSKKKSKLQSLDNQLLDTEIERLRIEKEEQMKQQEERSKQSIEQTLSNARKTEDELRKEVATLKKALSESKEKQNYSPELEAVKAELETARQDLEKKFGDTAQFQNMKKMLTTKNDQLKQLRASLAAKN